MLLLLSKTEEKSTVANLLSLNPFVSVDVVLVIIFSVCSFNLEC